MDDVFISYRLFGSPPGELLAFSLVTVFLTLGAPGALAIIRLLVIAVFGHGGNAYVWYEQLPEPGP